MADGGAFGPAISFASGNDITGRTAHMDTKGTFNTALGPNTFGFEAPARFFLNYEAPSLYEESIRRNEAMITAGGALLAETGVHTGRSPKDKFVVRDASTEATNRRTSPTRRASQPVNGTAMAAATE